MTRNQQEAYRDPLGVETFDGEVVITGPGRIGISLTAGAAAQTAERLAAAAASVQAASNRSGSGEPQPVTEASQASSPED